MTIRANKELLHYYRRFRNSNINENNNLFHFIQETTSPKICLPLSLLITFYNAHTHDLSGHPGREKQVQQLQKITISQTLLFQFQYLHKIAWIAKPANPRQTS